MPTFIGHAVTAAAISSLAPDTVRSKSSALLCAACAIAPDLDSITFRLGIPYDSWLGHRGFSHSLVFAGMLAAAAYGAAPKRGAGNGQRFLLWMCFFASAALHGVLDGMTNGGLGVAFFSPFDTARYFLPWRPIAVSPISVMRFFSYGGWTVLRSEFTWVVLPSFVVIMGASWFRKSMPRLRE